MASMNKVRWKYIADDATEYAVAATKAIIDQVNGVPAVKVGGAPASVAIPRLPPHIKPRYVYFTNGGVSRKVVVYNTTCDAWVTPATELTLEKAGADVTFVRDADGTRGQRSRNTCKQSA